MWCLAGVLIAAATVGAQAQELVPVEQAVEDLDPLARSLRRVEPGLYIYGQQTSLFRLQPTDPNNLSGQIYYRIGPGFRARVSRIDYLSLTTDFVPRRFRPQDFRLNVQPRIDGAFIELFGPNTVFDLTNPTLPPLAAPAPVDPYQDPFVQYQNEPTLNNQMIPQIDYRLDTRIDTRIDARIDRQLSNIPSPNTNIPIYTPPAHRVPGLIVPSTHRPVPRLWDWQTPTRDTPAPPAATPANDTPGDDAPIVDAPDDDAEVSDAPAK